MGIMNDNRTLSLLSLYNSFYTPNSKHEYITVVRHFVDAYCYKHLTAFVTDSDFCI